MNRHLARGIALSCGKEFVKEPTGSLRFCDFGWELHCPTSGLVLIGGVLGARWVISGKALLPASVSIIELEHDITIILQLPFVTARRASKLIQKHQEAASLHLDTVALIRKGAWWKDPLSFTSFGNKEAISISGVRYKGGFSDQQRKRPWKPNRRATTLDFLKDGIVLRRFRNWIVIEWSEVISITFGRQVTSTTTPFQIELRSGDTVAFETTVFDLEGLQIALEPVVRLLNAGTNTTSEVTGAEQS